MSKPQVESVNLAELFSKNESYKVPPYQREYAWKEEQINALLEDLGSFVRSDDPYYILGQVIIAPDSGARVTGSTFLVVDGQQRLTSAYMLCAALFAQFQAFGISYSAASEEASAMAAIRGVLFRRDLQDGSERQRFNATREADGWLGKIVNQEPLNEIASNTSQDNLSQNFANLSSWTRNNLITVDLLVEYTNSLLFNVYLVTATLHSEEQALEIFEKLNSRGMPLNSAELLKGLLFMNAPREKYETISKDWLEAAESVFKVRPHKAASMGYLMQAMLQPITGSFVSSAGVYKAWQGKLRDGTIADPAKFSKEIISAAANLAKIGASTTNDHNQNLVAARHFGVVQHLPSVLEATKFQSSKNYQLTAEFIDARVAISLFAEEGANSLNAQFWALSKAITSIGNSTEVDELYAVLGMESKEFDNLVAAARPRFMQLRYTNARDKKRMRFALASAASFVESSASNQGADTTVEALLKTTSRAGKTTPKQGYDLDHIFPQALALSSTFDSTWGADWVHSIGNLCLLHPTDNRTASASSPELKSSDYASSKLLLTKSLALPGNLSSLNGRLGSTMLGLQAQGAQNVESWFYEKAIAQSEFYFDVFTSSLRQKLGLQ
jgi:hypothetical protein